MEILKLPLTIDQNGFIHRLVKRKDNICLYAKYDGGKIVAFDVIRAKPSRKKNAKLAVEKYPGPQHYGRSAWSYPRLQLALEKYNRLLVKQSGVKQ